MDETQGALSDSHFSLELFPGVFLVGLGHFLDGWSTLSFRRASKATADLGFGALSTSIEHRNIGVLAVFWDLILF